MGPVTFVPKTPLISPKIPSNPLDKMKHIVESVEELYNRKEPTGEAIVDAVVEILRKFRLIYPEDVALLLDVKVRDLRGAWLILTGMKLIDCITQWRVLQAQDLMRKSLVEMGSDGRKAIDTNKLLREVARRCGWRSERVMSHVFERCCGISVSKWLRSISENN